jgi:predicted PurR-regulated permease PerM
LLLCSANIRGGEFWPPSGGALGVVILFAGDKIARPMLVGNATKLGFAWVLMGSLGGLEAIGLLGLFVGPVVLALAAALWSEWSKRARSGSVAQS